MREKKQNYKQLVSFWSSVITCVLCVCMCRLSLSLSTLAHKFVLVWTAACDRVKHVIAELRNYMILDCCLLFVVACLPVLGVALMYNQQLI
jgi:hypothetical protein